MELTGLPQPTVLLYGLRGSRRAALLSRLAQTGIRAVEVSASDCCQPLGALLGLPGFAPVPTAGPIRLPDEEMLVMFAFRGQMLSELLAYFREQGLAPVALKAMVTPTNIRWSSLQLYEALRTERAQIQNAVQKESV